MKSLPGVWKTCETDLTPASKGRCGKAVPQGSGVEEPLISRNLTIKKTKKSRMGIASTIGATGQIFALVAGLWATPRILSGLGDEAYGVLAIVVSFAIYFAYLELGLGAAYMREMSLALSKNDLPYAQKLLETAHFIYLRIGIFGSLVMGGIGVFYLYYSVEDPLLRNLARTGLFLTILHFGISMAFSAARGVVFSAQRTDLFMWVSLFITPSIPVLQVVSLLLGGGLVEVLLIQVLGGFCADLVMLYFSRRLAPELKIRSRLDKDVWKKLRGFSFYKFISQIAMQGQITGDRLLLGVLLPIAQVTPYAIAASIGLRVRTVVLVIAAPYFPAASERFAQEGIEGIMTLLMPFGRRVSFLLALANAGAVFLAAPFLTAWVGSTYAIEGASILAILVLATSFILLSTLIGQSTDAANYPKSFAIATTAGLIISIILGSSLVFWYGPEGVAFGFLGGALIQFFCSAFALGRIIGVKPILSFITTCIIKPSLIGFASYGTMLLFPYGETFLQHIPATLAGIVASIFAAVLLGTLRREDLPARWQKQTK